MSAQECPNNSVAPVQLLTPTTVQTLCKELQIRPTKQLGQNFVMDPSTVRKIVQAAKLPTGEQPHVLEVGPGLGSLTLGLLETGAKVTAVEIDKKLAFYLPQTLNHQCSPEFISQNFQLIVADALKIQPEQINENGFSAPKFLVSNLPYNVAVPVIFHCLAQFPSIETVLVMVQKEVALRLSADKGSKLYGVPSVKMAWYGHSNLAGDISRKIFYPEPNVDSALVRLQRTNPYPNSDRQAVFNLIEQAFSVRRKMLRGALKKWAAPFPITKLLAAAGIEPTVRAENLEINDFVRLAQVKENLIVGQEKTSICLFDRAEYTDEPAVNNMHSGMQAMDNGESSKIGTIRVEATAKAYVPAKINLFLAVGPNQENGYHQLRSFFQALDFGETVTVSLEPGKTGSPLQIELETKIVGPPQAEGYQPDRDQQALAGMNPEQNLAYRAVLAVAEICKYQGLIRVEIEKQVPVAGGMAGGSADAAAALLAANQVFGNQLSARQLAEIARMLGADVPFGLSGGSSFANGDGNQITPLPPLAGQQWVLAVHRNLLPTPAVFRAFDQTNQIENTGLPWGNSLGDYYQTWAAYQQESPEQFAIGMGNQLQQAAQSQETTLNQIIALAQQAQASAVQVCGSGPTVAALVKDQATAQRVIQAWRKHPAVLYVVTCTSDGENTKTRLWAKQSLSQSEQWQEQTLPAGLTWQSYWEENNVLGG